MISALRVAVMGAILCFINWEGPSHKSVSINRNF